MRRENVKRGSETTTNISNEAKDFMRGWNAHIYL
jgi:hypothetical protein